MKELDVIETTHKITDKIQKGMKGTIVHPVRNDLNVIFVEFSDENGKSIDMIEVPKDKCKVVWKFK